MPTKLLNECTARLREASGERWFATLITPGQGSSGFYEESMLAQSAAVAFPKGTKLWFMHPKEGEHAGQRDPRDQWGVLMEDARYEFGEGIVGEIRVLDHWKPVVDSLGTEASLSVWVMAMVDEAGAITELLPEVTNSVDIVSYPGRPGSGLTQKMYESARAAFDEKPRAASAQEKEGNDMEELLKELISKFDTFIAESKQSAQEKAQAEADAKAAEVDLEAAVENYAAAEKAISEAELLPSQAERIRAEAKKGTDVAPLIEDAKKVNAEAKAAFGAKEAEKVRYRVHDSDGGQVVAAGEALKVAGW